MHQQEQMILEILKDKNKAVELLLSFFKNVPREQIEAYIKENRDLLPLLKEKLNSFATWIVKKLLQSFWDTIEEYLTDTNKIIELIVRYRPDLKDLFMKKETQVWLYNNVKRIYEFLYEFTWK